MSMIHLSEISVCACDQEALKSLTGFFFYKKKVYIKYLKKKYREYLWKMRTNLYGCSCSHGPSLSNKPFNAIHEWVHPLSGSFCLLRRFSCGRQQREKCPSSRIHFSGLAREIWLQKGENDPDPCSLLLLPLRVQFWLVAFKQPALC